VSARNVDVLHARRPSDVRSEYEDLARDLAKLAGHFSLPWEAHTERDVISLAQTFEVIDRHVDDEPDAHRRAALCDRILAGLDGEASLDAELQERLAWLREVARDRAALRESLAHFFRTSETLRTTTRASIFIRCVLEEARCAADMTMLVAGALDTPRFSRFFRALSEIANLTDKLHDVRGDHARGEIAILPGIWLHLRLLFAFVMRGPGLMWLTPKPLSLVGWGMRYLLPARNASHTGTIQGATHEASLDLQGRSPGSAASSRGAGSGARPG
jgi:hypothetical protein